MEKERVYEQERFEFAVYVNDFIICKRNFKINGYIDHSMETEEFKDLVDNVLVRSIKDDLNAKSRVYTWYYGRESIGYEPDEEFSTKTIEPWDSTFKFAIYDNGKEVISRIWDGSVYPRAVRDNVDLANKYVKITTKDGRTYSYDKEEYFEKNKDRLTIEMNILRSMIIDRPNVLSLITREICRMCSPREDGYQKLGEYTCEVEYGDKTYKTIMSEINRDVEDGWRKALSNKTKEYFKTLY